MVAQGHHRAAGAHLGHHGGLLRGAQIEGLAAARQQGEGHRRLAQHRGDHRGAHHHRQGVAPRKTHPHRADSGPAHLGVQAAGHRPADLHGRRAAASGKGDEVLGDADAAELAEEGAWGLTRAGLAQQGGQRHREARIHQPPREAQHAWGDARHLMDDHHTRPGPAPEDRPGPRADPHLGGDKTLHGLSHRRPGAPGPPG
jgi:hypothetical protein